MGKILKELSGHSGSKIYLMEDDKLFVRKVHNVERNHERMSLLGYLNYPVPKIYEYDGETLDMEYIQGLDMKNYLIHNNIDKLFDFICETLDSFAQNSEQKYYVDVYEHKLKWMENCNDFPFTKDELIARLPKWLPESIYHGDFTLENIIYTNPGFHLIDPLTSEYDSYIFDIAKLRQDLECKWFIRNSNVRLDTKLNLLQKKLDSEFGPFNDSILILMLLRVYPYCKNDVDKQFIINEVNRLWKL
jgi:RIO-like serine/threonine protein kinase